jgi:hypothetical protein
MSLQLLIEHFSRVDNEAHISTFKNLNDKYQYKVFNDTDESIEFDDTDELGIYSRPHHINFFTFKRFVELLDTISNPTIVETGTSATLVNSSHFFDKYIDLKGGRFDTVDINQRATQIFSIGAKSLNSSAHTDDSVNFLKTWDGPKIDAVYLDSYDLDYTNPYDSALHGKKEVEALLPHLNDKAFLLIDDTPKSHVYLPWRNEISDYLKTCYDITGNVPGKGMFSEEVLKNSDFEYKVELHQHQVLYILNRKTN